MYSNHHAIQSRGSGAYASAKAAMKVNKAIKCSTKETFWNDANGDPGAFQCF